ncbi:Hsp70 family protein [Pseudothermotoga sp. U03pept]|uniref:Hsp70 family protein n=1 Tax=Pseudothermotoga sp. U03pept TaxID=3447012 RepID=UPI003F070C62
MIVGIDFGTTNTLIGYVDRSLRPQIIVNERGSRITPTVVHFKNEKQVLVGELAKSQMLIKPHQTILRVKRRMGSDQNYEIFKEIFNPSEIASFVFRKCKNFASEFLGEPVEKIVVTVPAYFDDNQRQAVAMSAKLAGLQVVKLLNEPTAAALAYEMENDSEKIILVLDFGGGTFDITLMRYQDSVYQVLVTGGSTSLGGFDFDQVLVDWIVETVKNEKFIDLSKDPIALQQIYNHAEQAKIDLSVVAETSIVIPYVALSPEYGPVHVNLNLSRERFENLTKHLLERAKQLIIDVLKEASLPPEKVDLIVFSGGTSRMPAFRRIVTELFPNSQILSEINPDEVVALGAARMAAIIDGRLKSIELRDVVAHSLGVFDDDGQFVPIIDRGTVYPTIATKIFTNTRDDQDKVLIKILQKRDEELVELGDFQLTFAKKWQKEEAAIAVSFNITHDGILTVTAEEMNTGEAQDVTIQGHLAEIRVPTPDQARLSLLNKIEVL